MKKILFTVVLSVIAFSSVSMASSASMIAGLAQDDRQVVKTKLTQMSDAFKKNNFGESVEIMPPKVIDFFAKYSFATREQFKDILIEMANVAGQQSIVKSYGHDLFAARAEKSPSGRDYVFVPTHLKVEIKGWIVEQKKYLLGIKDDNQWYIIEWSQLYIPIIKEVYPDLSGIKAPK